MYISWLGISSKIETQGTAQEGHQETKDPQHFTEDPFHDNDGGVIANMEAVGGSNINTAQATIRQDVEMYDEDEDGHPVKASWTISSPEKIPE